MLNFVSGNNAHFHLFTNSEKFEFLMSSTDESIINWVAKFVFLFMNLKEKHNVWLPLLALFLITSVDVIFLLPMYIKIIQV